MRRGPVITATLLGLALVPLAARPAEPPALLPGNVPADFALALQLQAQRRFTANDVQAFVHQVFSMYERATNGPVRVGVEAFRPLLADDVQIDFPDYRIRGWADFVAWHGWIHGQLVGDEHQLGPIDVRFLGDGRYQAHFTVLWRALFKTDRYTEVRVEQTWTLREQAGRDLPVIETYVARLADFRALP